METNTYYNPKEKLVKSYKLFFSKDFFLEPFSFLYLSITNANEVPTAKRKDGKTKSASVNPCHLAGRSGAKTEDQVPGVLTMIIKQIVIPRKMSRALYLSLFFILYKISILLKPSKNSIIHKINIAVYLFLIKGIYAILPFILK